MRQGAKASGSCRNRFQLRDVIQIVAAHGFDDGLESHLAAFRMREFLRKILRRNSIDQRQVPSPRRRKRLDRSLGFKRRVWLRPLILIERLNHVVRLRERLPQPEREHHFAVGKMAEDLPRAPFSWRETSFQAMGAKRRGQRREPGGSLGYYAAYVAIPQKCCVRVCSAGHRIIVTAVRRLSNLTGRGGTQFNADEAGIGLSGFIRVNLRLKIGRRGAEAIAGDDDTLRRQVRPDR